MTFLKQLLHKEVSYFKKLHQDTQKLLLSILLYDLIGPIYGTFINAFLWRQSQDIVLVAFENAVLFATVPLGFYLNGLLLRKMTPAILSGIALVIAAVAITILMFLPQISYFVILLFGIANGISVGIYWGNRNLLTLKTTTTDTRIYFSSLETTISTISKVIIPLGIGWFITYGTIINLYTPIQGYQMLIVYLLLITAIIVIVSRKMETNKQHVSQLTVKKVNKNWQKFRLLELVLGVNDAARTFIPILLVLTLLGNEEILGTVQSVSAILASIMVLVGVKSLHIKHRLSLISIGIGITLIGSVSFGILYSGIGVLIFFACQAIAWPFFWVALSSINYDLIDKDNKDPKLHYAYVCDQEIYLNVGRVGGILLFMAIAVFISNDTALRFAPLLFAATQILLFFTTKTIEQSLHKQVL